MKTVLTKRQEDIVRLLCEGKTCKQVGKVLNLSHHTVMNHEFYIKMKLKATQGVTGRTGMMCWAIAVGLFTIPNAGRMYRNYKPNFIPQEDVIDHEVLHEDRYDELEEGESYT